MGHRANLIITEGANYELYYDQWGAIRLDAYLFWGVDKAVQFFRGHDKRGEEWWLDNIWGEGGAIIDLNRKILLWFGGGDIATDIPLRRLFLALMRKNWQGFQIFWAYEGVADLADYVGYDRNKVIAPLDEEEIFDTAKIKNFFHDPEGYDEWDCAVSFLDINGALEIYIGYLSDYVKEFLYFGSDIVQLKGEGKFLKEYIDIADSENALHSGIHIDCMGKKLHIWSCYAIILDVERLQAAWIGYEISYHKDNFEIHAALTHNKLSFEQRSKTVLINKVNQIVCSNSK